MLFNKCMESTEDKFALKPFTSKIKVFKIGELFEDTRVV